MSWYVVGSDTFCIFNDILTQHLEVGMAGERTNFAASDWTVTGTSNHSHTNTMQVIFGFGTGSLELSKQSKRLILIPRRGYKVSASTMRSKSQAVRGRYIYRARPLRAPMALRCIPAISWRNINRRGNA